jgi:transcriptional antiterminator NusG
MLMETKTKQEIEAARVYAEQRAAERLEERESPGAKWYIVQCIRGTDQQALGTFDRYKIKTYYPKIMQLKPMPRRRMSASQRQAGMTIQVPTEVPLFPRYIFTYFDMRETPWRSACDLAGVGGLLCKDGMPVYMPDDIISKIRRRENNGVIPGKEKTRVVFGIGEGVIVTNGPFASFPGIVEEGLDVAIEKLEPSMRIKVALNIFGRATPVELEYWQVSKQDQ